MKFRIAYEVVVQNVSHFFPRTISTIFGTSYMLFILKLTPSTEIILIGLVLEFKRMNHKNIVNDFF